MTEYRLPSIDWTSTPLEEFLGRLEKQEDGTNNHVLMPHGDGFAPHIMVTLLSAIEEAYESLIPYDTDEYGKLVEDTRMRFVGSVPVRCPLSATATAATRASIA